MNANAVNANAVNANARIFKMNAIANANATFCERVQVWFSYIISLCAGACFSVSLPVRHPDGVLCHRPILRAKFLAGQVQQQQQPAGAERLKQNHLCADHHAPAGVVRRSRQPLFDPCRRRRQLQVLRQRGHPGSRRTLRWMHLQVHQ
jgi:hypothetical protein